MPGSRLNPNLLHDVQKRQGFVLPGSCDESGFLAHLLEGRHGSGVRVLATENKKKDFENELGFQSRILTGKSFFPEK